jgi:hypothetical protein
MGLARGVQGHADRGAARAAMCCQTVNTDGGPLGVEAVYSALQKGGGMWMMLIAVANAEEGRLILDLGNERGNVDTYFGPSISLDLLRYDATAKSAVAGVLPGVGYGLKLESGNHPFLAVDLFIDASIRVPTDEGSGHLVLAPSLAVTGLDWVSVGLGVESGLPVGASSVGYTHPILIFGVKKSTDPGAS